MQQLRLKKHIQVLLAEVSFVGCAGLEVGDEMRVTIAAQAAFLLLDALRAHLAREEPGLIRPCAATSPAELFAATTELFCERPDALAAERPALY
jgi:Mlc titration factor MtfA (ptsG expression regulator)